MKGQSSFEFMMIVIVVLLVLSLFVFIVFNKFIERKKNEVQMQLDNLCFKISKNIETAEAFGHGFSTTSTLPQYLIGKNYTVTVYEGQVLCETDDNSILNTFKANVTNSTHIPPFEISGEINIENVIGDVVIT